MASAHLYLGEPGCGKSYLIRKHARALSAGGRRLFIVDHDGGWEGPEYESVTDWIEGGAPGVARFVGLPAATVARLAIAIGDCTYVDDECDGILTDVGWKTSPLREIVKRGRHLRNAAGELREVHAMLATHRAANLPTDVVGLAASVYLGRLRSAADAERIYREGWIPEARSPAEIQAALTAFPVGHFRKCR